jgi:hypothetical protein
MFRRTRSLVSHTAFMRLALVLILLGLLLTVTACENLTADTSPSISTETVAEVAAITATTTAAATIPASESRADDFAKSPSPTDASSPNIATTSTVVLLAPMNFSMTPMRWTRYEEDDPRLNWSFGWSPYGPRTEFSGGWIYQTNQPASVAIWFEGSRVRLVAFLHPDAGIARLRVDLDTPFEVDFYKDPWSDTIVWTSPVLTPFWADCDTGILNDEHCLLVEWTGEKNPHSFNTTIAIDAVDVFGGTLLD